MSEHKFFLRTIEILAGILGVVAFSAACLAKLNINSVDLLEPYALYASILLPVIILTAGLLAMEFMREHTRDMPIDIFRKLLGPTEIKLLTQYCPRLIKLSVIPVIIASALLSTGEGSWTSADEINNPHALEAYTVYTFFCFLSLPVLASASRMQGSYSKNALALRIAKRNRA